MLSLFMVLGLLTPTMNVAAEVTTAEYEKVEVVNPVANTWNNGTTYPNDGGPAFAFNGVTTNWWHTNYSTAETGNKLVGSFTNQQVSEIPAFSEISSDRVWIGGEFAEAVNLGKFSYRSRTDNTNNHMQQWALYTANVETGAPTDADFTLAATGTFGDNSKTGVETVLATPVKATDFRLVAFTFNGGQVTASNIEMYALQQVNTKLRVGETVTYTQNCNPEVDNSNLNGLDSSIVTGKVIGGNCSMAKLATAKANFDGEEISLEDCLFTFNGSNGNYTISHGEGADTIYLSHNTNATAGKPCNKNTSTVTVSFDTTLNMFTFNQNSSYLYFHKVQGTNGGNLHFDRQGSLDSSQNKCTHFDLFIPSENAPADSEIKGYQKLTGDQIVSGQQYLIAAKAADGKYYVLNPVVDKENYEYSAQIVNNESQVQITFTAVAEGVTSVTVNGITYNITVKNENRSVIIRDDETIYIPGTYLQGEEDPDNVINLVDQTGAPYERAQDIEEGYYLLGNNSHIIINSASSSTSPRGLAMLAANYSQGDYSAYIWNVKSEGDGYTLQDINGKYINFSGNSIILTDTPEVLKITKRAAGGFAVSNGTYYINNYGGGNNNAAGYSGNDNAWYFYRVGVEITSAKLGNATIILDGINYQIESLPMSTDALNEDITYAENTYKEENYLVSGWRAYVAALADAKEWAEKATRQTEINAAHKNLTNAIANLVLRPAYVEPTATEMAAGAPSGTTEGQPLAAGTGGSANFRIPALITLSDGTIIAAADARWNHAGDACSIDIMVSKSEDNGKTWSYSLPAFFNDSTNAKHTYGACFIDPVMVRDANDKIYMMVDLYPGGVAINTAPNAPHAASGYVEIEGAKRLVLYLSNSPDAQTDTNYAYYVGDYVVEGAKKLAPVYEVLGEGEYSRIPSFYMDSYFYLYTAEKEPMYCVQLGDASKRVQQNVFFNNSLLHVRCATYLYLITSEDKGETWSEPMILNPQIRKDSNPDIFYGVGPGAGLWIDNGTEEGIVMLPAYTFGNQIASFIYSEDGGTTWKRSQDATTSANWSSESCLVQLDATTVRHFYRSGTITLQYTDHKYVDGQWVAGSIVTMENIARRNNNQVSAIRYSKTIDGKPVIIYSTAASTTARQDGKFYVFTVDMDAEGMPMTLVATYDNDPSSTTDNYAYSSIAELADGSIGLLYESAGSQITYKAIPMSEIGPELVFDIPASEDGIRTEVAGYTLSLEGNVGVNFHMLLGDEVLAPEANAYMSFALNGKEALKVPVADAEISTVDGNDYYVFKCTVPVKDMDTEITAQIILADGRKGLEHTYKVQKYIDYISKNKDEFQNEIALVETMSDFGDYASAYFADESVEGTPALPTLPELTTEDLTKLENNKGVITKDEDSIYYGSSLLLKSDTILRHYFKEKVEGSTQKGNLYYIDSTGIPAHKLGEMVVTKVGDMEITYNPLSYAYIALTREGVDEDLKSVMHAMYLYYKAAQEYNNAN